MTAKKAKPQKAGRKPLITPTVLSKIEECFLIDCTDVEACQIAGISTNTLYRYQEKHPEFRDRKQLLKSNITYLAKRNIVKALEEGNVDMSFKVLERKDPEYRRKDTLEIDNKIVITFPDYARPEQIERVPEAKLLPDDTACMAS